MWAWNPGSGTRQSSHRLAEGSSMVRSIRRALALVSIGILVFPAVVQAQATPPFPGVGRPSHQELSTTTSGSKDWITYGGALNNQRYSALNQITTSNVSQLKGAWMTRLNSGRGTKYRFEADPLVLDGVMYIPTGNDDIFALDAKTGRKVWRFYSVPGPDRDSIGYGRNVHGVGVGEG